MKIKTNRRKNRRLSHTKEKFPPDELLHYDNKSDFTILFYAIVFDDFEEIERISKKYGIIEIPKKDISFFKQYYFLTMQD